MERLDGMGYGCVLGPDVGKGTHHARLAGMDGARLWDGPVAQGEREMRSLYERAGRSGMPLRTGDGAHPSEPVRHEEQRRAVSRRRRPALERHWPAPGGHENGDPLRSEP